MSGFLDNLKKSIEKGSKVVTTKSNELIETNKVKSEINGLKKSKNAALMAIGEKVFETQGGFNVDMVADEIESIKEYDATIAEKEKELDSIKIVAEEKMNDIKADKPVTEKEMDEAEEIDIEIMDDDDDTL